MSPSSAAYSPFSSRPSLLSRAVFLLPRPLISILYKILELSKYHNGAAIPSKMQNIQRGWNWKDWHPREWKDWHPREWKPRRLLTLPHAFVVLWILVLLWGERWVFVRSIKACEWESWERWPKDATPHHLIFLADPQLIDPHTYPGRPWPLSTLTILHTDNYLKKSYKSLQQDLHPDTVFFLGDLFDGGREWKTARGNTVDSSWANGQRPSYEQGYVETWGKRYGEDFWLKEYDRFGRIFYNFWNLRGEKPGKGQRGRRIISSLPGNHDLGFGANIKIPIRDRFEAYFGEGNRVDVIANHTFVSIDSVSLSAGTASQEAIAITQPVEQFLEHVGSTKRRAVARELNYQSGKHTSAQYPHKVESIEKVDFSYLPTNDPGPNAAADFPTILLTHVPLFRLPGTPCGPKREHWPPATPPKGQTSPVFPDDRNAISISRGYQYQNVLSEDDSVRLVSTIGNVVSVFSGDDHDYCEVIHPANKNHAKEITVKSVSYAMGVRRPGFVMLSLWNPVDGEGRTLSVTSSGHGSSSDSNKAHLTIESHLCLLPDQLGILINYGLFIALTILILVIRAILVPILNLEPFSPSAPSSPSANASLLPSTTRDLKREYYPTNDTEPTRSSNSSTSSTSSNNASNNLAPRSSSARTRSVSPACGYGLPAREVRFAVPEMVVLGNGYGEKWSKGDGLDKRKRESGKASVMRVFVREAVWSIWRVTWVVVGVFLYLCWAS